MHPGHHALPTDLQHLLPAGGAWTADALRSAAVALRERADAFRRLPSASVLARLGDFHAEWSHPDSRWRAEAVAVLRQSTGYPATLLNASLRGLFALMNAEEMQRWLSSGGVDLGSLDAGADREMLVFGPALTAVVSSGNIPGAALPSIVQALLLKSPCLVKSGSEEPWLLPLYARRLAEAVPDLAPMLAVTTWAGNESALSAAVLEEADALLAYGGNTAIRELRALLPPHARFVGYGHRISFTAVARERLQNREVARKTAEAVALDLCLFDQQGCYSPQVIYVEMGAGVAPEEFGDLLAEALSALEQDVPRRQVSPSASAAIHQYRASLEMRSFSDPAVRLWSSEAGTQWTVALEPDPSLQPCPLNRVAVLKPVAALEALPELLRPHRGLLLAAVLAAGAERRRALVSLLGAAGVTRITTPGLAQRPQSERFHDGINAIGMLARFVTIENEPFDAIPD